MANRLENAPIEVLETALNDFDPSVRRLAIECIRQRIESSSISVPEPKPEVNLHLHTFFSFNAYGWSPSRLAWEAKKYGLSVAGIVDFDVLDGMQEFLQACDKLKVKGTVAMETRVYVKEYGDKVMTSPNEPGITYFMASGCFKLPPPGSNSEKILKNMAATAKSRNLLVVQRVNEYLGDVAIDYDNDVIPLTPAGNATERHLLVAYESKSKTVLGEKAVSFWAEKLHTEEREMANIMQDTPKFHELMRNKLMKFGGVGYVKPDKDSFPAIEDVINAIQEMEAIPMMTWLDGTNDGEKDIDTLIELMKSKGVLGFNIIPDRNWNLKNPEEKALKVAKLDEAVSAALRHEMPLHIGTEMNKSGQPFVDNFYAPELCRHAGHFIDGAHFYYGHTLLARYADAGVMSPASVSAFVGDTASRNEFYTKIGSLPIPSSDALSKLEECKQHFDPDEIYKILSENI